MPSFFRGLGRTVGRLAPAAIGAGLGFLAGGPVGAAAGGASSLGGRLAQGAGGSFLSRALPTLAGAGLGMAAGGRGGIMGGGGGGQNPAEAGMPYYSQIPGMLRSELQPYISSGLSAEQISNPIYERMATSPGAFIEDLMKGYSPSRGYQYKKAEVERAMRNAAAHGGFIGTPYEQQRQAELTQGLLSEDMQDFLNRLVGTQTAGLEGLGARTERGARTAQDYTGMLGSTLANQGYLAAQGRAQQMAFDQARRNARLDFLRNLLGGGASFFGGGGFGGGFR